MRTKYICFFSMIIFLLSCSKKNSDVINVKNSGIQKKYSEKLQVEEAQISNIKLYEFIDEWYGTKYKLGGMSKSGVDCSGFCNILYDNVYTKQLPRTSKEISKRISKVSKENLKEGHLVVFNIGTKKDSHVGVYLKNNRFVHASTSKGVMISSLDNPYYVKAYGKGGEFR